MSSSKHLLAHAGSNLHQGCPKVLPLPMLLLTKAAHAFSNSDEKTSLMPSQKQLTTGGIALQVYYSIQGCLTSHANLTLCAGGSVQQLRLKWTPILVLAADWPTCVTSLLMHLCVACHADHRKLSTHQMPSVVTKTGVQEPAGHFECEAAWRGQHAWTSAGGA